MKKLLPRVFSIVLLSLTLITVIPQHTFAACDPANEFETELGCVPNTPVGFVQRYYSIGLGVIGGVALLFIIFGGYILLTSQGNPTRVNEGKSYLVYSIVGLLLAIFGFVFVQLVLVDILHIPGFNS